MGWRWQGRDSRLESSSDGEIFDEENKEENIKTEEEEKDQAVKNKEENVKTRKGEKDQAVKNVCEIREEKEWKKNYWRELKTPKFHLSNLSSWLKWRVKWRKKTCILHSPSILKHVLGVQDHSGTLQQKHDL